MSGSPPPNGGLPPDRHEPQLQGSHMAQPPSASAPLEAAPQGPRPPSPAALWVSASWVFHAIAVVLLPVTAVVGILAYYLTVDTRAEERAAALFTWLLALVMGGPVVLSLVCGALGQLGQSSAWVRILGIISLSLSTLGATITAAILLALLSYR